MMMQNNNGENKRENFIPLSKQDVIKQCHALITQEQQVSFSDFCSLLDHYVHQQHHQLLNRLKNNYAYFDPNRDTLQVDSLNKTQYEAAHAEFHNSFLEVLKKANFCLKSDLKLILVILLRLFFIVEVSKLALNNYKNGLA